jgi:AraC family transcriptional regulator
MLYESDITRKANYKRINNVICYIEDHLDDKLQLDELSSKASFSPFHFHRIFSAIVGETVNSFIIRKRIERIAAILTVGTNETLVDLAYRYGFSSASSFSRTFRKFYSVAPSEFKEKWIADNSKICKAPVTYDQYIYAIDKWLKWLTMNARIEIKELPAIKLAGIMHIGKPDKINNTYERLFKWADRKGILNTAGCKVITIYHDNPRITEMSKVRQSACITIEDKIETEGDVVLIDLQKGKYAVGHFEISPVSFQKAWDSMCIWVMENGYNFRDGDYFEVYHNDYRMHPEKKFLVDICIPVDTKKSPDKSVNKSVFPTTLNDYKEEYKQQIEIGAIQKAYKGIMEYVKSLRTYFITNYPVDYVTGAVYPGNMDITYFPFTPVVLKKQKLKIAIVFNHAKVRFEIWLAGQNRQIQKKYWELFKESDWNKYHIPSEITEGFSILDTILVENPDFDDPEKLTSLIETNVMKFIKEITDILG